MPVYAWSAWAPDGIIEALETTDDSPVLGVQWHPELLAGRRRHERLFAWVVDEAEAHRVTSRPVRHRPTVKGGATLRIVGPEVA